MSSESAPLSFLADRCVAGRVVEWLRSRGYDVAYIRDEGLPSPTDEEIFARAQRESRIVLTFDLDFGRIGACGQSCEHSIIVFRLHNTRSPHVIDRLGSVLAVRSQALRDGSVIIVEESRIRVRSLPSRGLR